MQTQFAHSCTFVASPPASQPKVKHRAPYSHVWRSIRLLSSGVLQQRQPRRARQSQTCFVAGKLIAENEYDKDEEAEEEAEEEEDGEDIIEFEEMAAEEMLTLDDGDDEPVISYQQASWGKTVWDVASEVVKHPQLIGLSLYAFRVVELSKSIEVRLESLLDVYGSPSIGDIENFARLYRGALEDKLGEEDAGQFSIQVSSPGAERRLRIPDDLDRFKSLPLTVQHTDGSGVQVSQVLRFVEASSDSTVWTLADVKANSPSKGRMLSKRQKQAQICIPLNKVQRVSMYVQI